MAKLNIDVLSLVFETLENDANTLFSCLLINKTWCQVVIPILWRNPLKYLTEEKAKSLFHSAIHSFILNVEDELIVEHFTKEELEEIDSTFIQKKLMIFYVNSLEDKLERDPTDNKRIMITTVKSIICVLLYIHWRKK